MGKSKSTKSAAVDYVTIAIEHMNKLVDIQDAIDAASIANKLDGKLVETILDLIDQHENQTDIKRFPTDKYLTSTGITENIKIKSMYSTWKRKKSKAESNDEKFTEPEPVIEKETRVHIAKKSSVRSYINAYVIARLIKEYNELTKEDCYDKTIGNIDKFITYVTDIDDDQYFLTKFLLNYDSCDALITDKIDNIISDYVIEKVRGCNKNTSVFIATCVAKYINMCARYCKSGIYACHPLKNIKTSTSKEGVKSEKLVSAQSISPGSIILALDVYDTNDVLFYDDMSFTHVLDQWFIFYSEYVKTKKSEPASKVKKATKTSPADSGDDATDSDDANSDDDDADDDAKPAKKPAKKSAKKLSDSDATDSDSDSDAKPAKKPAKKSKAKKEKVAKKSSKSKKTKQAAGDSDDDTPKKTPSKKDPSNIVDDLSCDENSE